MRYFLPLLLTFTFACGEDSARPRTKQNQDADQGIDMGDTHDMVMDNEVGDMGCNILDCIDDESKMINLLLPSDHGGFKGHFEFEPEPFEFNQEDEDEEKKG